MKRKSAYIALGILTIFTFAYTADALGKSFGGKIIRDKSTKVEALEKAGYVCVVPGKTMTIKWKNGTTKEFSIPAGIRNVPGYSIKANQQVLGLYTQARTPITCTLYSIPPVVEIVNLDTITYYGTSLK